MAGGTGCWATTTGRASPLASELSRPPSLPCWGDSYVKARLAAEIQRQASMVGYMNAFHLMTLIPLLTAPLAVLFVNRHPGER
jgi:hypothetical protein